MIDTVLRINLFKEIRIVCNGETAGYYPTSLWNTVHMKNSHQPTEKPDPL